MTEVQNNVFSLNPWNSKHYEPMIVNTKATQYIIYSSHYCLQKDLISVGKVWLRNKPGKTSWFESVSVCVELQVTNTPNASAFSSFSL